MLGTSEDFDEVRVTKLLHIPESLPQDALSPGEHQALAYVQCSHYQELKRENIYLYKVFLVNKRTLLSTKSHTLGTPANKKSFDIISRKKTQPNTYSFGCLLPICSLFPILTFPSRRVTTLLIQIPIYNPKYIYSSLKGNP